MKDINGVPTDEYIGATFSIHLHDSYGHISTEGIFLHHGSGHVVRVARSLRGFKAYVRHLQGMIEELEENIV